MSHRLHVFFFFFFFFFCVSFDSADKSKHPASRGEPLLAGPRSLHVHTCFCSRLKAQLMQNTCLYRVVNGVKQPSH